MNSQSSKPRLEGLDVARFFAFVGMVIVNFKIAMGADAESNGILSIFTQALEGRAAATFVVLAGIGLGLAALRSEQMDTIVVTLKRAAFLLMIGLLNSLIFDADILHYYAFYFLLGVFCLPLSNRWLAGLVVLANLVFVAMILGLNYDAGWNWTDYSYRDFWTPAGFVRNLFFNGWHPVFPWVSFLLFGIWLSRLKFGEETVRNRLIVGGVAIFIANQFVSSALVALTVESDAELAALLSTSPIPPMPFYIIAGMSVAAAVIGLCLKVSGWLERTGILTLLTPAGRQTLTLYIAHIVIGMGTLEALGMLGGQTLESAVLAALVFCVLAAIYAILWSRFFKRGPIEALMRKLAG